MPGLPHARSFRELTVYRKQRQLARELFDVSLSFPRDERFALTDQLRRASRSIGAQIAEAWAKRRYERHFVSKLTDADGEQRETQHWILTAFDCKYLTKEAATELTNSCSEIGRFLGRMIECSAQFCQAAPMTLREDPPDEFFSQLNPSDPAPMDN